jgi:hypothetical protein
MSGNSPRGSYRTTKQRMMRAYDKLPRKVRRALQDADRNYVPQPLLTNLRRGWEPATLVKLIRLWDCQEHERKVKRGKVAP